jgi:hypothetical protein
MKRRHELDGKPAGGGDCDDCVSMTAVYRCGVCNGSICSWCANNPTRGCGAFTPRSWSQHDGEILDETSTKDCRDCGEQKATYTCKRCKYLLCMSCSVASSRGCRPPKATAAERKKALEEAAELNELQSRPSAIRPKYTKMTPRNERFK